MKFNPGKLYMLIGNKPTIGWRINNQNNIIDPNPKLISKNDIMFFIESNNSTKHEYNITQCGIITSHIFLITGKIYAIQSHLINGHKFIEFDLNKTH